MAFAAKRSCCKVGFFASPILTGYVILLEVIELLGWVFGIPEEPTYQPSIEEIYIKAIPHKIKRTKEAECDKMGI